MHWEKAAEMCSKRLQPYLAERICELEECQEIGLMDEVRAQLLSMSAATIVRCLQSAQIKEKNHRISTTKPGALLKRQISIQICTPLG